MAGSKPPIVFTDEAREKMSKASKGWWSSLSDDERAKISETRRAYWAKMSPESKKARTSTMQAAIHGKPRSEEHRRKLGEGLRQRWADGRARPTGQKLCPACGMEFPPRSHIQRFCSVVCQKMSTTATRFGMTLPEFTTLLEQQNGRCALCGEVSKGWTRGVAKLQADHCHKTGKFRGFLCGDCNTALGRFGDDPARLRAAADYLEWS